MQWQSERAQWERERAEWGEERARFEQERARWHAQEEHELAMVTSITQHPITQSVTQTRERSEEHRDERPQRDGEEASASSLGLSSPEAFTPSGLSCFQATPAAPSPNEADADLISQPASSPIADQTETGRENTEREAVIRSNRSWPVHVCMWPLG